MALFMSKALLASLVNYSKSKGLKMPGIKLAEIENQRKVLASIPIANIPRTSWSNEKSQDPHKQDSASATISEDPRRIKALDGSESISDYLRGLMQSKPDSEMNTSFKNSSKVPLLPKPATAQTGVTEFRREGSVEYIGIVNSRSEERSRNQVQVKTGSKQQRLHPNLSYQQSRTPPLTPTGSAPLLSTYRSRLQDDGKQTSQTSFDHRGQNAYEPVRHNLRTTGLEKAKSQSTHHSEIEAAVDYGGRRDNAEEQPKNSSSFEGARSQDVFDLRRKLNKKLSDNFAQESDFSGNKLSADKRRSNLSDGFPGSAKNWRSDSFQPRPV